MVELAPLHAAEKLCDDAVQHGAAPDHRLVAELGEGQREVDRDGGFADAAFAAGDGDEIFYARDRLAFGHLLGLRCAWWHLLFLSRTLLKWDAAVLHPYTGKTERT